ncbi:GntR family transcriptional regulator (plasmid) [Streptomyces anulatus]
MNQSAPHPDADPARRSTGRPPATPDDAPKPVAGLKAGGLQARVRAAVSKYAYGETLPPTRELARELGAPCEHVRAALGALEEAGEVALRGRVHRYRLSPGELHPEDIGFDRAVRKAIASRQYAPGTALPVGLLSRRHGVPPLRIARACRRLIADRLVTRRTGHAGPGYYVTDSLSIAAQAAATRKEEGKNRV